MALKQAIATATADASAADGGTDIVQADAGERKGRGGGGCGLCELAATASCA